VNPKYVSDILAKGGRFTGVDDKAERMEIFELDAKFNHPFFLAAQFHPEFLSRPLAPSPVFLGFVLASVAQAALAETTAAAAAAAAAGTASACSSRDGVAVSALAADAAVTHPHSTATAALSPVATDCAPCAMSLTCPAPGSAGAMPAPTSSLRRPVSGYNGVFMNVYRPDALPALAACDEPFTWATSGDALTDPAVMALVKATADQAAAAAAVVAAAAAGAKGQDGDDDEGKNGKSNKSGGQIPPLALPADDAPAVTLSEAASLAASDASFAE